MVIGAHYAKAYNTLTAGFQEISAGRRGPDRIAMPYCASDAEAKAIVTRLIEDSGFAPFEVNWEMAPWMEPPRRPGAFYGEDWTLATAQALLDDIDVAAIHVLVLAQASFLDETARAVGANRALIRRKRLQRDAAQIEDTKAPVEERRDCVAAVALAHVLWIVDANAQMRDARAAVHMGVQPDLADHDAIYLYDEIGLVVFFEMFIEFLLPGRQRFRSPDAVTQQRQIDVGMQLVQPFDVILLHRSQDDALAT
jgi:hypothetical protein